MNISVTSELGRRGEKGGKITSNPSPTFFKKKKHKGSKGMVGWRERDLRTFIFSFFFVVVIDNRLQQHGAF